MTASKCLTALACAFATAEAIALLGVSLGLWWAPRASLLSRIAWWRRKPAEEPALPPAAQPPAEPAAGAGAPAELPAAEPSAKSSTTTQRPSSGLELAAGGALGAHALECLPSEVSFAFTNALAASSSDESSAAGSASLAAVEEGEGEEGASAGASSSSGASSHYQDLDSFDSQELVFEPSSSGAPGLHMVQQSISGRGLAVRTEAASAGPGSPLLVSSYSARFVEVVNGCVRQPKAPPEPAYLSQPLEVAAQRPPSPRRAPSRALGRAASRLGPSHSSPVL